MKKYPISPYFDDFDEAKGFHQILFKPGAAVQARELTQLQTIIRDQIEKFGSHVFRHGSIVIPGNSYSKMDVDMVLIEPSDPANATLLPSIGVGDKVFNAAGVRAMVMGMRTFTVGAVTRNILAVSYTAAGTSLTTQLNQLTFEKGEVLTLPELGSTVTVGTGDNAVGTCAMAFINKGVYYVNGSFVNVEKQSIIIDPASGENNNFSLPTASVFLRIDESIVTVNEDQTLLDPAQGSYNYAAPGADRVRILLVLDSVDTRSASGNFNADVNQIEIMRFKAGVLLEHANSPKYNELEKAMAKRTHDESGDYVVSGFDLRVNEALKLANNGGLYLENSGFGSASDLDAQVAYTLSTGTAYVQGFEVATITDSVRVVQKPRDKTEFKKISRSINYGNYVLINVTATTVAAFNTLAFGETIQFRAADSSVIGQATFVAVDYYTGSGAGSAGRIDKLYFTDLALLQGQNLDNCAGVYRTSGGTKLAEFVYELNIDGPTAQNGSWTAGALAAPNAQLSVVGYSDTKQALFVRSTNVASAIPPTGTVLTKGSATATVVKTNLMFSDSTESLVHYLGINGLKSIKNELGNTDIVTTSWERLSFAAGSGSSTTVSAGGVIVGLDDGISIMYEATVGAVPVSSFAMNVTATGLTRSGSTTNEAWAYVQVRKVGAAPRMKTLVKNYTGAMITIPANTLTRSIELSKYDVVELQSVKIGGIERINDFKLLRNTTQFSYAKSSIVLRPGISAISSAAAIPVFVTFSYLEHSSGATSNYFTADSYAGIPDYYIEKFTPPGGVEYSMRDCIDLRTEMGIFPIVSGSSLSTTAEFWLGRFDLVVLNKDGKLSVINGNAAITPKRPPAPTGAYALYNVYLPPFTRTVDDIRVERLAVDTFTMDRINGISRRIDNLEEFALLTMAESQTLQSRVIDANTGLDKFKTGYLIENFRDPFVVADATALGFGVSISPTLGIYCGLDKENIDLELFIADSDAGGVKFDANTGVVSSNYTEEVFASNTLSSGVVNINPFNIVVYKGEMTLTPSQDFWAETLTLPEITLRRTGVAWDFLPDTFPQSTQAFNPKVNATLTNGIRYDLGANKLAYSSGPSRLSIDTIMGWETKSKSMATIADITASEQSAMDAGLFIYGVSDMSALNANQKSLGQLLGWPSAFDPPQRRRRWWRW